MTVEAPSHTVTISTPIGPVKALLPHLTCELPDGRTGHYQRRQDDCMGAALATCLQVAYEDVPDQSAAPGTYADDVASWTALSEWVRDRGMRLRFHNRPPEGCQAYIAVGPAGEDRYRHVFVVVGDHIFDPGSGFKFPAGLHMEPTHKVEFAISFEGSNA